jgi:hypothetical protein
MPSRNSSQTRRHLSRAEGRGSGATGQYLNKTVVPAIAMIDAVHKVVLAIPRGTTHIDEASDVVAFGLVEVA